MDTDTPRGVLLSLAPPCAASSVAVSLMESMRPPTVPGMSAAVNTLVCQVSVIVPSSACTVFLNRTWYTGLVVMALRSRDV